MTTKEIANQLVAFCQQGDFESAQSQLFAEDAISVEPYSTPDFDKETKGLAAIKAKGEKWMNMVQETHHMEVSDPLVATNSFACTMRMHVTMKERGEMDMTELCLYTVKDGKIVAEQFYM